MTYADGRDEPPQLPPVPGYRDPESEGPLEHLEHLAERLGPALEAAPGVARVAAAAGWHTTVWGVRTTARGWLRVAKAVTDPDEAEALARDVSHAAEVVGDVARSVSAGTPIARALMRAGASLSGPDGREGADGAGPVTAGEVVSSTPPVYDPAVDLRRRGAELLERSRDVWNDETAHPAYARILDELAPDEARILLLLIKEGPQPSVDVRTGGPIGMVNSQLIAPGLTMIGARAGCRYLDQVPAYLNNLHRLGLIWFSREPLKDPMEYQVVEAQPDVLAAVHSVKFAKVVRRSIHLTPFGDDFCRTCLLSEEETGRDLPAHALPPETHVAEPPKQ